MNFMVLVCPPLNLIEYSLLIMSPLSLTSSDTKLYLTIGPCFCLIIMSWSLFCKELESSFSFSAYFRESLFNPVMLSKALLIPDEPSFKDEKKSFTALSGLEIPSKDSAEDNWLIKNNNINKNRFILYKCIIFCLLFIINNVSYASIDVNKLTKLKKAEPINSSYDFEKLSDQVDENIVIKSNNYISAEKELHGAIEEAAKIIQTRLKVSAKVSQRVGTLVIFSSKQYNIDPRIMLSIIKVESEFKQSANNTESCKFKRETNKQRCGDHSIAQINYHIWKKRFLEKGRKPLDFHKLKTNDAYAIFRMAEILSILKQDFKNKDDWYAYYHSGTPSLKNAYRKKVDYEFKKIQEINPVHLFKVISKM